MASFKIPNKPNTIILLTFKVLLALFLVFIVTSFILVFYYRFFNPSSTPFMRFRMEQLGNKHIKIKWIPYEKIGKNIKLAVVTSEDSSFLNHKGFNFKAIENAYYLNKKLGFNKYGASTISQQVAKNLFLWNGKSWTRKVLEAYFTSLIELNWSKKRILEVYLNIIEYGKGVFGIYNATNCYFEKNPSNVTPFEASLITAALPSPLHYSLLKPSNELLQRSARVRYLIRRYKGKYNLDSL
ncbi:monofunctional biosynthetic peptidoglycan transglycosylase [Pedobacter africanus]|uniref:Monofunctional biosynthetic peptidoglycan transglycosylase n=1 Tax=Pedobacter africanus TaxID=151894 RepID=A0ACC6KVX8_9SPHI|nr:monofunctional biosynthetic peptidoglycan transglycosylase [Pedobacter africanus]MDR6783226.1 monofunctional biosynthetic peptidoglycan transglycosylase [Pedobacter africanus]